jgi:malonate decarboxylase epsilon subunit
MSVALLFPGQGAQRPGMLQALPDSPAAGAVIAEARSACAELRVTGDLDNPGQDTVTTQLSLVVTGAACGRALVDDAGLTPAFVAGHSVGAFAAAVVAEVLTLREALMAVHERAESMRAVCSDRPWGMAAITGLRPVVAQKLAEKAAAPNEPVWLANVNTATQTVLGGTIPALTAAERLARRDGARSFERLDVEVASHGPLQEPTAQAVRSCLSALPRREPAIRYITNVGGRSVNSAAAVHDDLASSVSRPVRWYDGIRLMSELGVTCTVESTPGHTLTRLAAAAVPMLTAIALDEQGLRNAGAIARRHL